ncbi:MAG: hypothetical protein H7A23_14030 [Leptospiraceae bacterium]|nr:hypothetical protein [Leptospiraceae bacterium]MCP5495668.1 hypothetical protein [Leptospiraceae bacterium]
MKLKSFTLCLFFIGCFATHKGLPPLESEKYFIKSKGCDEKEILESKQQKSKEIEDKTKHYDYYPECCKHYQVCPPCKPSSSSCCCK